MNKHLQAADDLINELLARIKYLNDTVTAQKEASDRLSSSMSAEIQRLRNEVIRLRRGGDVEESETTAN